MEAELSSQLENDLKQALRAGDKIKLSVIRAILAAVEKAESDRQKKLVDDAASRGVAAAAKGNAIVRGGKIDESSIREIALAAVNSVEAERVEAAVTRSVAAAAEIMRQAEIESREIRDSREMARQVALAAVDNAEITRRARLQNADVLDVIGKQAKQREESIAAYKQANRPELVRQEEAELAVLKTYLPQAASHDDIVAVVRQVIAEVGAQGQRDKGKVMQKAIAQLKGRADGRAINEVVTELLK